MSSFIARTAFHALDSIPRSYYLGHHAAGLAQMRTMLSQIDLIIECRDYRVPLTSQNPQFEEALAGKSRLIVYTKKDLGTEHMHSTSSTIRHQLLRKWHRPSPVLFSDHRSAQDVKHILKHIQEANVSRGLLTGSFLMVVGMPNVGKSSLLNALRQVGVGKGKAARTGAQPGITRAIAKSGVKIISGDDDSENVYLVDTPGVFIPYVPDAEAMLKLALCGSVKDTIISPVILADYLLFEINRRCPDVYGTYHHPTNEIMLLLEAIARKTGRLGKTGALDTEAAALWFIQKWREGLLGKFVLDEVTKQSMADAQARHLDAPLSLSQARKASKELARQKSQTRNKAV